METVAHHDRETAFATAGDGGGSPVCFVHGAGATREVWHRQLDAAGATDAVAPDLSGHGDSADVDAAAGYQTLAAYADDVLAVLAATDARVLVGNSLGGAVVMHVAIERAVDLDGIVLSGTGARLGVLEDLLRWLDHDFERAVAFLHGPDRLVHDPDSAAAALSADVMTECGRVVTRRDFHTAHRFDVRDRLDAVDVPTLVIAGEDDQLTPPWFHEYLAEEIPDAELIELADAAQLSMLERPETFSTAVFQFARAVTR